MASSQWNPLFTQQSGSSCPYFCFAIRVISSVTRCFGSQNCRARRSGIRASVLPLGDLQSVARIGSQTTSTRTFRSGYRARSCSAAEDPRRQPGQVGDSSNTIRGKSASPSKAAANSRKSAFESTVRGSWPGGTEEGPQRYKTAKSKTSAITVPITALFFISRTDQQ